MSDFRTVTDDGATTMFDAAAYPAFDPGVFDGDDWRVDRSQAHTKTGRGGVRMLDVGRETWVRRHYHRGGLVAKLVYDSYGWTGLERSRPMRELKLLARMRELGLPVPAPVAARVVVAGFTYRADLITVLLPQTRPLSNVITADGLMPETWPAIGAMVARFHAAGIDHPDLTAHNILLDADDCLWLLDFDNARLRAGTRWRGKRLARLRRSFRKVALETGTSFDEAGWDALAAAYRRA